MWYNIINKKHPERKKQMENFAKILSEELGKSEHHIQNVIDLLADGNTIPFIAR